MKKCIDRAGTGTKQRSLIMRIHTRVSPYLLSPNNFAVQVFLVRKRAGKDAGTLYAMKVLKKATLKG